MRKGWLLLVLFVTVAVLAACGTNYIQEGTGPGTPTPTTSPPPFAGFNNASTGIEPIMLNQACGRNTMVQGKNCHDSVGSQLYGTMLVSGTGPANLATGTNPLTAAQLMTNWEIVTCINEITSYNPPGGQLWTNFCVNGSPPTHATTGNHQVMVGTTSRTAFTDNDCLIWYNYLNSGAPGTNIRTCPH